MVLRSNWVLGEVGQPGAERAYRRAKSRSAPLKDITNAAIHNAEACRPPLPPARDSVMAVSAIGREAKVDPQQPLPKVRRRHDAESPLRELWTDGVGCCTISAPRRQALPGRVSSRRSARG